MSRVPPKKRNNYKVICSANEQSAAGRQKLVLNSSLELVSNLLKEALNQFEKIDNDIAMLSSSHSPRRKRQNWTRRENETFFKVMEELKDCDEHACVKELVKVIPSRTLAQLKGKIKNMREAGKLSPKLLS